MKAAVKTLPGAVLTVKDPRVIPLPDSFDLTGQIAVINAEHLSERYRFAGFQLQRVTGGFGARSGSLGSKMFVQGLADGEETYFRTNDVIGTISEEHAQEIVASTDWKATPVDVSLTCIMVIDARSMKWGKGQTIEEARKNAGISGRRTKGIGICRAHPEAYVNDMLGITLPAGSVFEILGGDIWQNVNQKR